MKNLKNLLLSIPLILSISCATLDKKNIELSKIKNVGMLIQNSGLFYEDYFTYTKIGIEKFKLKEANPIAKIYQDNLPWELVYIRVIGKQLLENGLSYKIDKSGILASIIHGTTALIEILAIQNNSRLLTSLGWKEDSANINRYVEIFRINY